MMFCLTHLIRLILFALLFAVVACSGTTRPISHDAGHDASIVVDSVPVADMSVRDTRDSLGDAPVGDGGAALCPVTGYAPCGGDLLGVWTFVSLCPENQAKADALLEHPYDNLAECKDRSKNFVKGVWHRQGSMTFDKDQVTVKMKTYLAITYGFTDVCLAAAKPSATSPAEVCIAMNKSGKLSCSYAKALCTCAAKVQATDEDSTTSYTVSGNVLRLGSDKESATFCRTDDVLILDWTPHPVSWRYWILKRP